MAYTKQTWTDGAAGGTPTSAARFSYMETGIENAHLDLTSHSANTALHSPATEIDSAERATMFDVQAIGVTQTDVDGMFLVVPPQTRPYMVRGHFLVYFVTGTAASASVETVQIILVDHTSTPVTVGYAAATGIQPSAASKNELFSVALERRFEPNAATKYYKIQSRLLAAAVTNWTSAQILAGNAPDGDVYPPMVLAAVSC